MERGAAKLARSEPRQAAIDPERDADRAGEIGANKGRDDHEGTSIGGLSSYALLPTPDNAGYVKLR